VCVVGVQTFLPPGPVQGIAGGVAGVRAMSGVRAGSSVGSFVVDMWRHDS